MGGIHKDGDKNRVAKYLESKIKLFGKWVTYEGYLGKDGMNKNF